MGDEVQCKCDQAETTKSRRRRGHSAQTLDDQMPGGNSFEVSCFLRTKPSEITVFILRRRIQKEVRRRSVLGASGTTIDYLAERLRCGREEVIEMTIKYPRIMRLSGPKIKEVIDFLLKNGYTVDDVRKVPKVLFHSTETMNDRLDRLKQYDHRSESLIPLCKSKQQFEDYLQRIVVKWLKSSSTSE